MADTASGARLPGPGVHETPDGFRAATLDETTAPTFSGGRTLKERALLKLAQWQMDTQGVRENGLQYAVEEAKAEVGYDDPAELTTWERAGQDVDLVGVMLTVIIAAVIGYVGLTVMSQTEDSSEFTDNSAFDNASTDLTGGVETVFGLVDVVFIALFLALIIGALLFLRRR